ncbi:hypothetical protein FO675_06255 [Riemerella anatipestifer]|uniref:DUF6046 domain-containing protein n=1 Tax=Riemerella anatipestifer TaxID=34085 RepID=UPI001AD70498|nr:DUF6046 domain-containing protein [Riemerella anatipestifer]MBO4233905.1 hypothetical protein [Riemerella anatipestifer]
MITVFDLGKMYKEYFGRSPYYITPKGSEQSVTQDINFSDIPKNEYPRGTIHYSRKQIAFNKIGTYGQDIWFPIEFYKNGQKKIEIEACTIAVNLIKNVVKTPVSERVGTVKEIFNIDDYKFTIRGFVIGKNRKVPEDDIANLKNLFETGDPVELHGGYPEIFLEKNCNVVITSLEFPEVQGKTYWIRPFTLTCESDFVQELEIN